MPDAAFETRVAHAGDIATLAVFAAKNFSEVFTHYDAADLAAHLEKTCSHAYFADALAASDIVILVAHAGGQLIGYSMVGPVMLPVDGFTDARACEIYRLYVDKGHHGTGVAQALMDAALATPQAVAAPAIYLSVWAENHKAQRFYAKYGFVAVGEYLYPVGRHLDQEIILCQRK